MALLDDIVNQVTGTPLIRTSGGRLSAAQLALENSELQVKDGFWEMAKIDGTRWNKNFPYELILVKAEKGGGYTPTAHRFTLPIPPTEMSITMPFAIHGGVTLGGYVEEHNGTPIRGIVLSGTTGVMPLKSSGNVPQDNSGKLIPSILAGTINAANGVVNNAIAAASGHLPYARSNVHVDSEFGAGGAMEKSTGYYQFHLLGQFLESYGNLKKLDKGKDIRLAFAVWKDQAVYLVTPITFDLRRNAQTPWEYNYTLNFRAFKRIQLNRPADVSAELHSARNPDMLAQVLNRIGAARDTLQALRNTIGAVRGDVQEVLQIGREVALFCKDALGVGLAAADLPGQIVSDFRGSVLAAFESVGAELPTDLRKALADAAVRSGQATSASITGSTTSTDAIGKLFENADDNYEVFSKLDVGKLNLPPEVSARILRKREEIRQLQRLDFERMRDTLKQFASDYAFDVGLGHETYAETFRRSSTTAKKTATADDHEAIFALNNMTQELNRMAAIGTTDSTKLSPLEYVAGLASRSGIAFNIPKSKYPVPFPYGFTLEQLAARYLGDPNRWHEIATLNGLRDPFVDETGFDVPVVALGYGNQIAVESSTNLNVGQIVTLAATGVTPSKRRIMAIDERASEVVVLTLDGDPDLDRFTPSNGAVVHAYLPDTVNSQMTIYIPSDVELDDADFGTKDVPGTEDDHLLNVGGIDLLLGPNNDLVFTPDGDTRLAVGLTNLVQRVKLALATPRGSLLHHPTYGVNLSLGMSTAEVSAQDILTQTKELFRNDPAFTGVQSIQVVKIGPMLRLTLSVGIAGTSQLVPVTVDLK